MVGGIYQGRFLDLQKSYYKARGPLVSLTTLERFDQCKW